MNAESVLVSAHELSRHYAMPRTSVFTPAKPVIALEQVSFNLSAGRNLGVVGESGSGKSTLARLVMALERPSAGEVLFRGVNLHQLHAQALRRARAHFQMVFQDPYGSLDPRQTVATIVQEPLECIEGGGRGGRLERMERVQLALEEVGLRKTDMEKYPHEFSGGQRQRIAIARALITRPALIVADEPVSALDVSVQAQVLNLMQDLQDRHGLSYLFISHDLAVVDLIADDVIVLQAGRVVEQGPTDEVFRHPRNAYTQQLIAAVPGGGRI